MNADFALTGYEEIDAKLLHLASAKVAKRMARKAMRKSYRIVLKSARQNAKALDDPSSKESIAKNITMRAGRDRGDSVIMRIGVRGGARRYVKSRANVRSGRAGKTYTTGGSSSNPGGDTFYWRYLEFGTKHIKHRYVLIAAALSSNVQATTSSFVQEFRKELNTEIAKR